tara:strand:- start:333 stop:761 length:429 start_codon:yes stop_codon:yes gene_type:complete
MKITKHRLKEIIREELSSLDEKNYYPTNYGSDTTRRERTPEERDRDRRERERQDALHKSHYSKRGSVRGGAHLEEEFGLGDLQSDEKFTGGSPEERMLTLIKARELLTAMSEEDLTQLSLSLDGETTRALQHLLANPMYKEQ